MVTADMVARINAHKLFMEVLIAPDYEPAALELLQQKKNLRILRTGGTDVFDATRQELRSIDGGLLVQTIDTVSEDPATFTIPTKRDGRRAGRSSVCLEGLQGCEIKRYFSGEE